MQAPEYPKYTYADYLTWNDGKRYELIDGEIYMMSPAPSSGHQRISGNLFLQIATHLRGKKCEVFAAPFDVRLNADAGDDTVVQPDISVICDPGKIDKRGCKGVPDMVIEILSPSSINRDFIDKFSVYRDAGIREYWIVHPDDRNVHVFLLKDGQYISQIYGDAAIIPVSVLEGCQINMADVFPPGPPKEELKSPIIAGQE